MIYTVTLNPAIDYTITIDNFILNKVNRISDTRYDIGGKGINVSKVIQVLGGSSTVLGITGGDSGNKVEVFLKEQKISYELIKDNKETRTNIKMVDSVNHTFTDMNEAGGPYSLDSYKQLETYIDLNVQVGDILVLAGSLPKGCSNDIYHTWIHKYQSLGVKVYLDASGDTLKNGIQAKPYLVKPNIEELEYICGHAIDTRELLIQEAKRMVELGVPNVIISLGAEGALYCTEENIYYSQGIPVTVESTVGAGDSMVAAFAYGESVGLTKEETFKLSIACGTVSVQTKGSSMPILSDIKELQQNINISKLELNDSN